MTLTTSSSVTTSSGETTDTGGTVTWLDDKDKVALQANRDVAGFYKNVEKGSAGTNPQPEGISTAAGIAALQVAATLQTNHILAGQLGVSIVDTVLRNKSSAGHLEITVTNNSSVPLTLNNQRPADGDVTSVPDPLFTAQSGTVLLTRESGFDDEGTNVELQFWIGDGRTIDKTKGTHSLIQFALKYGYTKKGGDGSEERWTVSATVDGAKHEYPKALQMFGFNFKGSTDDYPSFSVYTSTIEPKNGTISMVVYDR